MLMARWIINEGHCAPYKLEPVSHGEWHVARCVFKFNIGDRKITEVQNIETGNYLLHAEPTIVADHVVEVEVRFKGFTRDHTIDIAVVTETPTGTRGGERTYCTLVVEAMEPEPPPHVIIPDGAEEFFVGQVSQDRGYLHTEAKTTSIVIVFEELKYRRRALSLQHVSISQLYPELDTDDPYRGPTIQHTELLNDGSGVFLQFDELRIRHNYQLAIDTDVTSMRILYLSTK